MSNVSDPIPYFGGTYQMVNAREIHVFSDVCSLMEMDIIVNNEQMTIPVIFYQSDGSTFCPADWQSIPAGFGPEDIDVVQWIDIRTGKPAIMLDGLPRHFAPFSTAGRPRKNPVQGDENGHEYFEAVVTAQGTTGRLYPPKAWIGRRVRVTLIE